MSNDNFTIKPSLINAWSARLAEQVPFCPCPPETAKPALVAVDGGILSALNNVEQALESICSVFDTDFFINSMTDKDVRSLMNILFCVSSLHKSLCSQENLS